MNKTQTKKFEKKVSALENGKVVLATGSDIRAGRYEDGNERPSLGYYLTGATDNLGGIDNFLLGLGIDDLDGAEAVALASTATHSPTQNAVRAARALRRLAAKHS